MLTAVALKLVLLFMGALVWLVFILNAALLGFGMKCLTYFSPPRPSIKPHIKCRRPGRPMFVTLLVHNTSGVHPAIDEGTSGVK